MLWKLVYFEIKQWLKNILFFCYIAISCISIMINLEPTNKLSEPNRNQMAIGHWDNENTEDKMDYCIGRLVLEFQNNQFVVNKYGMRLEKELEQEQLEDIDHLFAQMTGMSIEDVVVHTEAITEQTEALDVYKDIVAFNKLQIDMDYLSFCKVMDCVDEIIGGGSSYGEESRNSILTFGNYEEEVKEYNSIIYKDKVSNAYARLFCDYALIDLSLIPIFLAVYRCFKDKKGNLEEVVFLKRAKSFDIIFSRYIALTFLELLSVILISVPYQISAVQTGKALNVPIDYFAFLNTILLWLLPSILIVNAIGFAVTEITRSRIAILIQSVWWFFDLNIGTDTIVGRFSFHLMPRFNAFGKREIYEAHYDELLLNRAVYALVAFLLLFITINVYEKRRTGCWRVGQVFRLQKEI